MWVIRVLIDFLLRNWISVIVILGLLIYTVYLALCNRWDRIRELAYELMLLAERNFRDSEGNLKFDFVVKLVYQAIPGWMKIFVKESDIHQLIQKWYLHAKDFLDDGKINDSAGRRLFQ